MSLEQFRHDAHEMVDYICDYYASLIGHGSESGGNTTTDTPTDITTSTSDVDRTRWSKIHAPPSTVSSVLSRVAPGYLQLQQTRQPGLSLTSTLPLQTSSPETGSIVDGGDEHGGGNNGGGGDSMSAIMGDVTRHVLPGVTHWQHPQFFAFFSANSSFPAMLGEMLSTALNVIGFNWVTSPACTELETLVMQWMGRNVLHLPSYLCGGGGGAASEEEEEGSSSNSCPNGRSGKSGGGVIQGSASEAVLVAMLAAKDRAIARYRAVAAATENADNIDDESSLCGRLVVYCSDQSHSSVQKAALIAGIQHFRIIPTHHHDHSMYGSMRMDLLEETLEEDCSHSGKDRPLLPCFLVATLGTTATTAVDPLHSIACVVERINHRRRNRKNTTADVIAATNELMDLDLWVHVDAAFMGAQLVLPQERRHILQSMMGSDTGNMADMMENDEALMSHVMRYVGSFCFNPHKWLLVNFDCSALFVRDRTHLVNALSVTPSYLRNTHSDHGGVIDYRDWQVPLGRKFRALKLWMVLRSYSVHGLQQYIAHHLDLARRMEQWIRADNRFELCTPRTSALLVFRMRLPASTSSGKQTANDQNIVTISSEEKEMKSRNDKMQRRLLEEINANGEVYLVGSEVPRIGFVLRVAICGTFTELKHVKRCWGIICDAADKVALEYNVM